MAGVSIIIPTLNEEVRIGLLLTDIEKFGSVVKEVLVVDGGSRDGTKQQVKNYPMVKWLPSGPPVGKQRQTAAQKATGEWLLFLDADTRLSKTAFEHWLTFAAKRKLGISCPFYWPQGKSLGAKLAFVLLNFGFWFGQTRYPSGAGAGFLVRKTVWKKAGGLRTDLVYEDIEFIRRAAKVSRFGMVGVWLRVSDRRWVRDGAWNTFKTYVKISRYFVKNDFSGAEQIPYHFGAYGESSADEPR